MEKYGTYRVYKNKIDNTIKRIPSSDEDEHEEEKTADADKNVADDMWEELDYDPETMK